MILIRCPVLAQRPYFFSARVLVGWAGELASLLLILPPTPRRAAGATNGTGSTVHRRRLERVRKSRVDTPGIVSMRRAAHASTALAMLASRLARSLSLQSVPSDVDTMTTGLAAAQAALDAYEYDRARELLEAALVESRGGLDVARAFLELLVDVLGPDADALAVEPGSRGPRGVNRRVRCRLALAVARIGQVDRALAWIEAETEAEVVGALVACAHHELSARASRIRASPARARATHRPVRASPLGARPSRARARVRIAAPPRRRHGAASEARRGGPADLVGHRSPGARVRGGRPGRERAAAHARPARQAPEARSMRSIAAAQTT
jgi:hypothetical protein